MKNKSFSNKLEELKSSIPTHLDVEKRLLPRLKFMGYLMFAFCFAAFAFALSIKEEEIIAPSTQEGLIEPDEMEAVARFELLQDDGELELSPTEVLNFYLVAGIFAVIGTTCFLIAWRKKKKLFQEPQPNDESNEK
jgi:hypothetical protein